MEGAWNYVGAGYGITTVVIASYMTWMFRRTRRLRRTLADESDV